MKNSSIFYTTALLLCTHIASAEPTSHFNLELGRDEDNGSSAYFDADIGTSSLQFLFGAGQSMSGLDNSTTQNIYAGLGSDPAADQVTEFTLTQTEAENNFDLLGAKLDLIFNSDDWAFILTPELRDVTIYYTQNFSDNSLSPGIGFNVDYYAAEPFFFSLAHNRYYYEDRRYTLNINRPRFNISNTFTLNNGLDETRNMLAAGFNYRHGNIGIKHQISNSTDIHYTSNTLYISYQFNATWSSKLSIGNSDDETDTVRFASVSLGYTMR